MPRILSKGSRLEFADFADWDENVNIRDYDIVFVNLRDLERRKDEFLHRNVPERYKRMYTLPESDHVLQLLVSGGDMIIGLPFTRIVSPSEDQDWEPPEPIPGDELIRPGTPILYFLSWLPFDIPVYDDGGESVDEDTIHEDWEWYFNDAFSWNLSFPQGRDTVESIHYEVKPLVENRYGECLAAQIVVNLSKSPRAIEVRPDWGTIYMLPLLDGWGFENLAEWVMEQQYPDVELETVGRRPDWLDLYEAPHEGDILVQIDELQDELAQTRQFKRLLWEYDDELQKAVYDAFRKAGLTVHEEEEGRRDGAIELDDHVILLEITGTTGSVTEGKLSQGQKWVIRNAENFDKDVSGMFVINHFRDADPAERELDLDPERRAYIEDSDLQLVTTLELFKMVHGLESGDLSCDAVESKLRSDSDIIEFDEVDDPF